MYIHISTYYSLNRTFCILIHFRYAQLLVSRLPAPRFTLPISRLGADLIERKLPYGSDLTLCTSSMPPRHRQYLVFYSKVYLQCASEFVAVLPFQTQLSYITLPIYSFTVEEKKLSKTLVRCVFSYIKMILFIIRLWIFKQI